MNSETKTCSKCGEVKPVDAFYKNQIRCKSCSAAYNKAYYKANMDKFKSRSKANKDKIAAWRKANKDHVTAYQKAYQKKYRETTGYAKAYYEANKEKLQAKAMDYYQANKDKRKAYESSQIKSCSDSYIIDLLTKHTPIKEVPKPLIRLKRVQLLIKRKIKELKKCK